MREVSEIISVLEQAFNLTLFNLRVASERDVLLPLVRQGTIRGKYAVLQLKARSLGAHSDAMALELELQVRVDPELAN